MSSPIFLSSGDVIADRRFEWARDREAKGDLTGAADLLVQALELAPSYASAWFMLGELRERLGDRAGAVAAFGQAKSADPDDVHGAGLRLTRLGVRSGSAMGEGYVRALFDRSEEHTSELQSHRDLHSFPTRRSSDLIGGPGRCPRCRASPHAPGRALGQCHGRRLCTRAVR